MTHDYHISSAKEEETVLLYLRRQNILKSRTTGHIANITHQGNNSCAIICAINMKLLYNVYGWCIYSHITCPRESERYAIECSDYVVVSIQTLLVVWIESV